MALYESVFIARQDVSATQVDALVETFSGIITAQGGKVAKKEYWGLRNLTFRIKKNRKGHYVLLNLEAPAAAINEMERNMRINEDVIRYLTIRVEALEEGPSAMLQSRGREGRDRDGRDRDRDGGGGRFRDRDRDRDGRGDRDREGRDRDRDGPRGRGPRAEPGAESAPPRPSDAPAQGENR